MLKGINSKNFNKDKLFTVSSPTEAVQKITSMGLKEKVTILLENDLPDNYSV